MYHPVKSRSLIVCLWFLWAMASPGKVLAKTGDSLLISEFADPVGSMTEAARNASIPLLQSAAFYGLASFLEGETHNFMGKSYTEMTATAAGIVEGNAFANAAATVINGAINTFTLVVEPYLGESAWVIKLIPDGNAWAVPVMFLVYYRAHNKNYDFYAMDKSGRIALHSGSAAMGLTYAHVEKAFNKGFELLTGQNSPVFGAAATSVVTAVAIGLLATVAGVDISGDKFNDFTVLNTALAVGYTVAYSGKAIRLGVQSMLVEQSVPGDVASRLGGAAAGGIFTASVVLLSCLNGKLPEGMKNYHGKVTGDMTKNIGLIFSLDLMRPGIQFTREYVHSAMDRVEEMLAIPQALRKMSYVLRDPAMILAAHQGLVRVLGGKGGDTRHIRTYDLIVGYSIGGFLGVLESPYKMIADRAWGDHVRIWALAALTSFLQIYLSGSKSKVD